MSNNEKDNYILITPAYNEEINLPDLISSVVNQKRLPYRWVIVNDGSNDLTGLLAKNAACIHDFIRVIELKREKINTYYSRKIHAFNQGLKSIKDQNIEYSFIGNLDADIVLPSNYYESMIFELNKNEKLGIVGGSYKYKDGTTEIWGGNYIPGPIMFFRKKCFDEIGGYRPLRYGAEDTLACIIAEEKGWIVKYIPEHCVTQNRIRGTVGYSNSLSAKFHQGIGEFDIGYHPLFSFLKFFPRAVLEKPLILGSLCRFLGYLYGHLLIKEKLVPNEAKAFLRKKQIKRILRKDM